jgi:hypothetical protein
MKYLTLICIIFLISIFSCSDSDNSTGSNPSVCTDNNSFDCARRIYPGEENFDTIKTNTDNNYFIFTTYKPVVIEVNISQVPSNLDLNLEIYKQGNPNKIKWNHNAQAGQDVSDMVLQKEGTFFIKIYDRDYNASNNNQAYKIVLNLDSSDIYEYNNSFEVSSLIPLNTPVYAKIKPGYDIDIFKSPVYRAGVVDIRLTNVPSDLMVTMELFSSAYFNPLLTTSAIQPGQSLRLTYLGESATYYARLYSAGYSNSFYTLRIDLDTTDIYEMNNMFENATLICKNTDYFAKIYPAGDEDFYKISLTQNNTVWVTLVPLPIRFHLEVYNDNFSLLHSVNSTGPGQPINFVMPPVSPGDYFIVLSALSNAQSEDFYKLRID